MVPPPPPPPAPPPPPGSSKQKNAAPVSSSSAPNRSALLADIEKKKTLKKTVTNDRSAPMIDTNNNNKSKNITQTALRPGGPPMTIDLNKNKPNGFVRPSIVPPLQPSSSIRQNFSPSESPRVRQNFTPPSNVRQNFSPPSPSTTVRPTLTTPTSKKTAEYSLKDVYNRQPSVDQMNAKRASQVDNESGGTVSVSQLRNQITQQSNQNVAPTNQSPVTRKTSQKFPPPPPPSLPKQPSMDGPSRTMTSAPQTANGGNINNTMFSKPYQTLKPPANKNRSALHRTGSQEDINKHRNKGPPPPPPPRSDSMLKPSQNGVVRPAPPPPPGASRPSAPPPPPPPPPPPSVQLRVSQDNSVTIRSHMNGTTSNKTSLNGYPPPTPLVANQSLSSHSFEDKFKFRKVQTLPEPDSYSNSKKVYSDKRPKRNAPPIPTR